MKLYRETRHLNCVYQLCIQRQRLMLQLLHLSFSFFPRSPLCCSIFIRVCVCVCLLKIIITIKQKPIPNQTNIYRPRYSSPASEQNNPTAYQTVTVEDTPLHGVTNKERQRLCVYIAHAIFPKIRNTQVLS